MQDLKKMTEQIAKAIEKMDHMSTELLQKVRDQEPEKIDEIMSDKAQIMKAIRDRDFNTLNNLKAKYADHNN